MKRASISHAAPQSRTRRLSAGCMLSVAATSCIAEAGPDRCDALGEDAIANDRRTTAALLDGLSPEAMALGSGLFEIAGRPSRGARESASPQPRLLDSPVGRELLDYARQCALLQHPTLETAGAEETQVRSPGEGKGPALELRALQPRDERLLSACLLAHLSRGPGGVPISLRIPGQRGAEAPERDAFAVHEGAFFGSAARGRLYACQAEPRDTAESLSPDRAARVCTDGSSCLLQSAGACEEICDQWDPVAGYSGCRGGTERFDEVANTFLRDGALLRACQPTFKRAIHALPLAGTVDSPSRRCVAPREGRDVGALGSSPTRPLPCNDPVARPP